MFTTICVIIGIIWAVVEECKKKPSDFYLSAKEFSLSPEGQKFSNYMQKERNAKRNAKARKRQKKRQNRQIRNLIIARHCVKSYNNFVFGNKKRR